MPAFAHDAEARAKHIAEHQQANQPENDVRIQAQVQVRGSEEQPPRHRYGQRDQHQHGEDLQEPADYPYLVRVRNRQEREQPAHQAPVEAGRVNDKAPEDEEVRQANRPLVEDARLHQYMLDHVRQPAAKLVEPVLIPPLAQQSDELPNPVAENAKRHEGQQPQQHNAGQTEQSDFDWFHSVFIWL